MKKITAFLACALILLGTAGAVVFIQMQPPKSVFYTLPAETDITIDIAKSKKHIVLTPYLKFSKTGIMGPDYAKFMAENESAIRNAILFTVREKTEEDLADSSISTILSDEIINKLREEIDVSLIEGVFFRKFYIA